MLKAIVFDFDGVILESLDIKTRAFKALFKDYPEYLDQIVQLHLDHAGVSRFEKFKVIYRDYLKQPLDDETLERLGNQFSAIVHQEILVCPFVTGAYPFIQKRALEYRLFIASGTPQEEMREIVQQRDLAPFFCEVHGSPRKKEEIVGTILADYALAPSEVLFIGDAMSDYQGACKHSMAFIGRVPAGEPNIFPEAGVLAIVEDLEQLDRQWYKLLQQRNSPRQEGS